MTELSPCGQPRTPPPAKRQSCPMDTGGTPFHFRTRDRAELGLSRRQLDQCGRRALVRGVRSLEPTLDLRAVCRALSLTLPRGAAFSHSTALELLGLPVPREHMFLPLHVTQPSKQALVRRSDVVAHRGAESRLTTRLHGLRVVSAADAWLDVAPGYCLEELVVVADAIVNRHEGADLLLDAVIRRPRRRGIRAARTAIALARVGSRSPQETSARLMLRTFGLPEPVLNMDIYNDQGEWLAQGDLVWPDARVIVEYQGSAHLDSRQFARDRVRIAALREHGWTVIEVTYDDIHRTPERTARQVARDLGVPCRLLPMSLQELAG